jgi:hypothetical protein
MTLFVPATLVAIGHGVWTWHAERTLRARIDALHARGEQVLPDDFAERMLDEPGNAATDITAAATILEDDTVHSRSVDSLPTTRPISTDAWPYLGAAIDWFEPALRRVDRAETKRYCRSRHLQCWLRWRG